MPKSREIGHVALSTLSKAEAPSTVPNEGGASALHQAVEFSLIRRVLVFLSLLLCIFLYALDQLIVATAMPHITDEFHSLQQFTWMANAFFLTMLSFNLLVAQWLQIFPSKHVTLAAVFVFELGSLVCGVAPSMTVLILGRAIAGLGASAIMGGSMMIMTEITTMAQRARYVGTMGVCFAIASVLGPLVGGVFADHVSWRWCFYINIPPGGLAIVLLIVLVKQLPPYGRAATYQGYSWTMLKQVRDCDWVGAAIVPSWGCCLILGLERGGIQESWSSGDVIALLVMIPMLLVLFFTWEYFYGKRAMLPLHMLRNRTISGAAVVSLFAWANFMVAIYYISEMYQAVYGSSATKAGIDLLPSIATQIAALVISGRVVARWGRPYWVIVTGPAILAIGSGLLYSLKSTDHKSLPMGYSAIVGLGVGMVIQNPVISVQYAYKSEPKLIATATTTVLFFGFAGRNIGLSLAGSVFGNMIKRNVHQYAPDLPPDLLAAIQNNANAVYSSVPPSFRPAVLKAYTKTLGAVFIIGVPASIFAFIGALCMDNVTMDLTSAPHGGSTKGPFHHTAADSVSAVSETDLESGKLDPEVDNDKQLRGDAGL